MSINCRLYYITQNKRIPWSFFFHYLSYFIILIIMFGRILRRTAFLCTNGVNRIAMGALNQYWLGGERRILYILLRVICLFIHAAEISAQRHGKEKLLHSQDQRLLLVTRFHSYIIFFTDRLAHLRALKTMHHHLLSSPFKFPPLILIFCSISLKISKINILQLCWALKSQIWWSPKFHHH